MAARSILRYVIVACCMSLSFGQGFSSGSMKLPDNLPGAQPVYIGFHIEDLGNFNTNTMTYECDMYLRMSWQDDRLRHSERENRRIQDFRSLEDIWLPDVYFVNAKRAEFQTVPKPNFDLQIEYDGTAAFSARLTLLLSCPLRLHWYPMDKQICRILIQSYGHPSSRLELLWFDDQAVTTSEQIELTQFYITNNTIGYCNSTFTYAKTNKKQLIDDFSCLEMKLFLKRGLAYHLVQTFIPSGVIVVVSWVSFWIDHTAVPARVTLSFTTLVTEAAILAAVRHDLPPVSYSKALDYWTLTCLLFVFAALVEFAIVNSNTRGAYKCQRCLHNMGEFAPKRPYKTVSLTGKQVGVNAVVDTGCAMAVWEEQANYFSRRALWMDRVSRVVFPLLFLFFNLAFWLIYLEVIPLNEWLEFIGL